MNITCQYLGHTITSQQASISGEYDKIYSLPNGKVKKVENIYTDIIQGIQYYRDDDETELQALEALSSYDCSKTILVKESFGTYSINIGNAYYNGVKVGRYRQMIDQGGESICYQELDMITNEPIFEDTRKYLGTFDDERDEYYCRFHYNSDGSLYFCEFNYMSDYDKDEFHQNDIQQIRNKFVLSDAMYNYYLTAEFFPPIV